MATETDQKTLATLTPGAGAGIGKVLADALIADPAFLTLMIEAAKGGLEATRSFWVKSGHGSGSLETEPDYRVRVQTLFGLLAHMEGEPIKRVIHQHLGGKGDIDPLAALQESPALREAARRMLEKAEFRTNSPGPRRKAKPAEVPQAEAIEV